MMDARLHGMESRIYLQDTLTRWQKPKISMVWRNPPLEQWV
jgi:hypothetical protein